MIGAVIGDIAGSRFEFDNYRAKDFEIFTPESFITDDSIMTLAVAKALLESGRDYTSLSRNAVKYMREIGCHYPDCGYGAAFLSFIYCPDPEPYNSWGNGAAMRVSAVPYCASSIEETKLLSRLVTEVSHNHPEGIKGAEAAAVCGWMALNGKTKDEIRSYVEDNYYSLDFTIDSIRPTYVFNESSEGTVPQAIEAFLESVSFEDAVRTAVSVGGDSDTLAAITGGIAEAYYGVPLTMRSTVKRWYLDKRLLSVLNEFEKIYPPKTLPC